MRKFLLLGISTAVVLALTAPQAQPQPGSSKETNVAILWNIATLDAISSTRTAPTVAARAFAVVHTCMFNAWTAFADARSTRSEIIAHRPRTDWTRKNRDEAVSFAAYRCLTDLFPAAKPQFDGLMQELEFDPNDAVANSLTPAGIGNFAAQVELGYRHHDGSNQLGDLHPGPYSDYTGYQALNTPDRFENPDHWQPLRVSNGNGGFVTQQYVTPQWGLVEPFALKSGTELRSSVGPALYEENLDLYVTQANRLITLSAGLTDEEKVIAEYWALGPGSVTPPGRWFEFSQYVSARDHHSTDDDIKLFFVLGNAMLDASIACWDNKRAFDSERPISAIRFLYSGVPIRAWAGPFLGTQWIDGGDWRPYQEATVVTPAFPEFMSGHSTFSAAGAEVLRLWTGRDEFGASYTALAGSSVIEPGQTPHDDLTLHWKTFLDAANQAGMSRRYGGIHFEQADLTGRATGRLIARMAWARARTFWSSSTH